MHRLWKGNDSFGDIAKKIGTSKSVVHRWYLRYKEHGTSAFDKPNKKMSYIKEFKLSIIEEYSSGDD